MNITRTATTATITDVNAWNFWDDLEDSGIATFTETCGEFTVHLPNKAELDKFVRLLVNYV